MSDDSEADLTRALWRTAALFAAFLIASCGCGVSGGLDAGTPPERCVLPPDIGKTGGAPHTETGLGADSRNYHPLNSGAGR
jgi:hypothetical protein